MSDVRYNTIIWTHRATRGWSNGGGLIDPMITDFWRTSNAGKNAMLAQTRNWVLIDAALLTLDGGSLHPAVAAQWPVALQNLSTKLHRLKDVQSRQASTYIQRI